MGSATEEKMDEVIAAVEQAKEHATKGEGAQAHSRLMVAEAALEEAFEELERELEPF